MNQRNNFTQTSPETPFYNCIAWACEDDTRWYWPDINFIGYWPPHIQRRVTIPAFIELFRSLGYEVCNDHTLEAGFEKITIYARNGVPTHAARHLSDGSWTSKLGRSIDGDHTLNAIAGGTYGHAQVFMRRSKIL